jgi:hypothetical protein
MASLFTLFALVTSLLNFDANPLALHPLSKSDGRFDCLFVAVKAIFVAFGVILRIAPPSGPALPVISLLIILLLLCAQILSSPYNSPLANYLRAASIAALLWTALTSTVGDAASDSLTPAAVSVLFALIIPAAVLGVAAQRLRFRSVDKAVALCAESLKHDVEERAVQGRSEEALIAEDMAKMAALFGELDKSLYDVFYSTKTGPRVFHNHFDAMIAARRVIARHDRASVALLVRVLRDAVRDNRESAVLHVFVVSCIQFVVRDARLFLSMAAALRKKSVALDCAFVIFTLDKKALQDAQA